MRRILIGTLAIAALALGTGVMAQTPVPGGSGSQVTNPKVYRNYAEKEHQRSMMQQQWKLGLTTGSVLKKKHHTNHH